MFDAGFTEIASEGGQAGGHNPGAHVNPQVTSKSRHDKLVMLMPVTSDAVRGL